MSSFTAVAVATVLYGLVIGSFVNVIVDRLPVELVEPNEFGERWTTAPWSTVLRGRSRCSSCGAPVRSIDNIPLFSYLVLRGRCRSCRAHIPAFHPMIEALVPVLGLLAVWRLGVHPPLLLVLPIVPTLVATAAIDLRTMIVPTRLVWPTLFVSVALSVGICVVDSGWRPMLGALCGVAAFAGPLFVLWWFHPRGMGFGDVRLAVLLGWNLGFLALLADDRLTSAVFVALCAMVLAALVGLTAGLVLQIGFGRPIPFGPALVAGAFTCMLLAEPILRPLQ